MLVPVLHADRVTLRPLSDADVERLAAIVAAPGVREWWDAQDDHERLRRELRNDGAAFALEIDGTLAGWLAISEETDPDYRHAGLDIILAPRCQGRGLGPEALRAAIRWLTAERGHHRFTIDPALRNERASALTPRSALSRRCAAPLRAWGGWRLARQPADGNSWERSRDAMACSVTRAEARRTRTRNCPRNG